MSTPFSAPAEGARREAPTLAARWRGLLRWLRSEDQPSENLPRFFLVFLSLFALGMVAVFLFGDQGWLAYRSLQAEAAGLRQEVEELRGNRQGLAREIQMLNEDPEYIEYLARQRLRYVRAGDKVLEIPRHLGAP